MTTVAEVYFLVRTGVWDEDDLDNYIQTQADQYNQEYYDDGFKAGYTSGEEDGREAMYRLAVEQMKCLR
jgi:flagellar biosynthesis/type III secretory pathway protein FliH